MAFDPISIGLELAGKVIDRVFPDPTEAAKAKLEMMKMQQQGEFKQLDLEATNAVEQLKVNAIEAANDSVFVSGWRPAVGWMCCSAYAYNYVFMPLVAWGAKWYDPAAPNMITLDTGELTTLLFGMLGLGTLRTYEKIKGASSK
jgi:hypothetical protein